MGVQLSCLGRVWYDLRDGSKDVRKQADAVREECCFSHTRSRQFGPLIAGSEDAAARARASAGGGVKSANSSGSNYGGKSNPGVGVAPPSRSSNSHMDAIMPLAAAPE